MLYYFAARYSRHAELAGYRDRLALIPGAEVTSRWIDCHDGELESSYTPEALAADPASCWQHGQADMDDLLKADVIVSFTGNGGGGEGGRHIEHGAALGDYERGLRIRLIVVGLRENIFHCHPATEVFADFDAFFAHEFEAMGRREAERHHLGILDAGTA